MKRNAIFIGIIGAALLIFCILFVNYDIFDNSGIDYFSLHGQEADYFDKVYKPKETIPIVLYSLQSDNTYTKDEDLVSSFKISKVRVSKNRREKTKTVTFLLDVDYVLKNENKSYVDASVTMNLYSFENEYKSLAINIIDYSYTNEDYGFHDKMKLQATVPIDTNLKCLRFVVASGNPYNNEGDKLGLVFDNSAFDESIDNNMRGLVAIGKSLK